MKIMKKIAVAVFAGAMVFGLVSCGAGDDPENAIKGSGKNYSIDYTNEGTDIYRAYSKTAYAHAGAAVEIKFENVKDKLKSGVMGLIFDLNEKEGDKRDFSVIGIYTKKAASGNGNIGFYISTFTDIKNIRDKNFGASTDASEGEPKEKEWVKAFVDAEGTYDAEKDTMTVYAYAIEKKDASGKWNYEVYLLNNTIAKLDKDGKLVDDKGNLVSLKNTSSLATIPVIDDKTGKQYTGESPLQRELAVYANIYPTKENAPDAKSTGCGTLTGKWTYRGDYKEVGVDED